MDLETAIAHIETALQGGDEEGLISEDAVGDALETIRSFSKAFQQSGISQQKQTNSELMAGECPNCGRFNTRDFNPYTNSQKCMDCGWIWSEVIEQERPTIVCLCGSTRFSEAYQKANFDETLAGKIVLTIGCDTKRDDNLFGDLSPQEFALLKKRLDQLHKRKIDLADEILVLNVGGYVGESTRGEIEYAKAHGKTIRWLE
jgi:DNA-directed RNA polymerase subunit RPC12/RpoP